MTAIEAAAFRSIVLNGRFCSLAQEAETELDSTIVSSNHCGTLRHSTESKAQIVAKPPPIYDAIATKPTQSLAGIGTNAMHSMGRDKSAHASSATTAAAATAAESLPSTNPFSTYDRGAGHDYRYANSIQPKQHSYHTLATTNHHLQQSNLLDCRQANANHSKYSDDYGLPLINNTDLLNLSNSSIANQLLSSSSIVGIGSARIHATAFADNHINVSAAKEASRNHIITDTIPGPESCV